MQKTWFCFSCRNSNFFSWNHMFLILFTLRPSSVDYASKLLGSNASSYLSPSSMSDTENNNTSDKLEDPRSSSPLRINRKRPASADLDGELVQVYIDIIVCIYIFFREINFNKNHVKMISGKIQRAWSFTSFMEDFLKDKTYFLKEHFLERIAALRHWYVKSKWEE